MLKDKVIVITGASSGIGAALAVRAGREHANVVIAARSLEKLNSLAGQIGADTGAAVLPLRCDITDRAQAEQMIDQAIRRFGKLDILVNNAGRGHLASVDDTTDEVIQSIFALNVFALWYATRPALRQMKRQGNGHIVNIASMAGKVGYPFNSAYVAAKHACVGFTHALRQELAETNIHATVVCPAGVSTEWAARTEGSPMLPLLKEAGAAAKRIAAERGLSLPTMEGVLTADQVAAKIVEALRHPVPEVYTHKGSREFAVLAAENREAAEHQQLAVVLGEREVYERYASAH